MTTSLPLLLLLLSLLLLVSPSSQSSDLTSPTRPVSRAHAELTTYGFPIGLLPAHVRAYSINATSGDFYVDLHGPCRLTLPPDNYLAAYSEKITGKIVRGRIAGLEGIRVRAFFRWWSINGIKSSGENLVFEVGGISAKYPSNNFNEAPACDGRKRASS
ncbi:uncharacterized protein J3R85_014825 [Psidium guajava]|nr:uncharacterized protein J3R85_014825 [Psidium guajava]